MLVKLLKPIKQHKLIAGIICVAVVVGGYYGYTKIFSNDGVVRYATAQAQKGTLIVSISGSGQVSASNQVDIKPKVSGDIVYVGVKNGQEMAAGTLIAQIDAHDAQKTVRDAEANFESAKLTLQKLIQPADMLSILQAENALIQTNESKRTAEDNLQKAYDDGFNDVANAFLDLPATMTGLQDILFGTSLSGGSVNAQANLHYYADAVKNYDERIFQYRDSANNTYQKARISYDKNFDDYKTVSRFSDRAAIESIINETYNTTKDIAEAVKSANNLIQFYKDHMTERNLKTNSLADTHLSNLNTYTSKTSTHLANLLSIKSSIQTDKDAITAAERNIAEKTESLAKLKAGADDLDIQSSELSVKQRENALLDAKEKLADYFIRPPFDGIITDLQLKKGDSISPSTLVGTLLTKQKIAEISLNEVDVAKIKANQKATLTFDAIPNLTITGGVAEIDAVGTVSQGVVTYTVKIGFDTQDEQVKPSMSVSAAIITEAKPNVLLIPNSAVKSQGGMSYVEIVEGNDRNLALAANATGAILKNSPRRQQIEIGDASDEFTEVQGGLKEGDLIVTRTIQPTSAQSTQTQQQSGGLRIPGLNTGGTGGARMR